MTKNQAQIVPVLLLAAAAACSSSDDAPNGAPSGNEVGTLVPPGKADNYFSTDGQEYTVTGRAAGSVDAACLSQNASSPDPQKHCSLRSIGLKNFAIAWFLNQYIIDKHDAPNEDWGGFTAMTRPESYEALDVSAPDASGKFAYDFTSELSGPLDLLDKIPTTPCGSDERCFTLEIPVLDNAAMSQPEWYRKAPYNAWNPATYSAEKETLELRIKPYPRSNDAYLEYQKLFAPEQLAKAGGKLAIGLFVGWDYYDDRYDLQTAKELYRWLTEEQGFVSPAASFDALGIDSGELTKTIRVNGVEVPVGVRLVHPGQGDPASPTFAAQMKDAMIQAFGNRQIVVYEGHAGPLYGFALANWNATEAGELDDSELPNLAIPENFYQVVLASGCDTYMVADSLYLNPVKQGRVDLDIITTSSFSNAAGQGRTSKVLLGAVLNQDEAGALAPKMYGEILRELNQEYWMTPLYGVHGIDDNPRTNPFANADLNCTACQSHDQCGGYGNLCLNLGSGNTRCGTKCESNNDCPAGYACWDIAEGDTIVSRNCAPSNLVCGGDASAPTLWINEIHYDNAGADVDEGVEIAGSSGSDLTGYSLVFYNGKPGQLRSYKSVSLEGEIPFATSKLGVVWVPVPYIQNGGDATPEPDGVALVDPQGRVLQLLSYEGAFSPTNGPAQGMGSTDIGLSETASTPVGQSLQLTGSGTSYAAFSWTLAPATPGALNGGQSFQ